jgi:hypothetical protein
MDIFRLRQSWIGSILVIVFLAGCAAPTPLPSPTFTPPLPPPNKPLPPLQLPNTPLQPLPTSQPSPTQGVAGDFTPCQGLPSSTAASSKGPYWGRLMLAYSPNGLDFVRPITEPPIVVDQASAPDAVILPNGRIILYFMAACETDLSGVQSMVNRISAAISDNFGETWVYKHVFFHGIPGYNTPEGYGDPFDPNIVLEHNGNLRLFTTIGGAPPAHLAIASFASRDGINFDWEGMRYTPAGDIIDPENYEFPGGIWRIMGGLDHGYAESNDDGGTFVDKGTFPTRPFWPPPQEIAETNIPGQYRVYTGDPKGTIFHSFLSTKSPWDTWTLETTPSGTPYVNLEIDTTTGLESSYLTFPTVVKGGPYGFVMIYETVIPGCQTQTSGPPTCW